MKLSTPWFWPLWIFPSHAILIVSKQSFDIELELECPQLPLLWIIFLIMMLMFNTPPHSVNCGWSRQTLSLLLHVGKSGFLIKPGSQGVESGIHRPVSSFSCEWNPLGHLSCFGKQFASSFWKKPSGHLPLSFLHLGNDELKRQSWSGPKSEMNWRSTILRKWFTKKFKRSRTKSTQKSSTYE